MIGSLISGIGSLVGGFLNRDSQKDANALAAANAAEQMDWQKKFAKNSVRWRAEDAKAAGIHPLFAMGAQLPSYQPVSQTVVPETGLGDAIASGSQWLGRAAQAGGSVSDGFTAKLQGLQLQRGELENAILASQLQRLNAPGTGPGLPSFDQRWAVEGQVPYPNVGGLVKDEPLKRTVLDPGRPFSEPGVVADMGYSRTSGGAAPIPSKDFNDRAEDNFFAQLGWFLRNNVAPSLGFNYNPPPTLQAGPGERVRFNPFYQEYEVQRKVHSDKSWPYFSVYWPKR